MSKTIRRKKHLYARDTTEFSREISKYGGVYYRKRQMTKAEQTQEDAKFFSDRYEGFCVPHRYVNLKKERPLRRKIAALLHKYTKDPDNVEVILPKAYKDAGWDYW